MTRDTRHPLRESRQPPAHERDAFVMHPHRHDQ